MIASSSKAPLALLLCALATASAAAQAPHDTAPALHETDGDAGVAVEPGVPQSINTNEIDAQEPHAVSSRPLPQSDAAVAPRETISEAPVSAPAIDGFGSLTQDKGGMPDDIWKSSTRETVDPLLMQLHSGVSNETLQNALANLLMTQATPPRGNGAKGWFAQRAEALVAIGKDDKAEQMIASLPASMTDASLQQALAELRLTRGEYAQVCEKLQPDALPTDTGGEGFWRKLSILCKANAGKQDEAMVGVDLLREEQHTDDLFFQEAIRKMGDRGSIIKSMPKQWTPLNIALLKLAGDTEKLREHLDAFPPSAVKYLAQDAKLDIKLREKATGRAQQLGILPDEAGRILDQPFSRPLASDVTTLVTALSTGKPVNDSDNAVIARLALDEAGIQDTRRLQRLLALMEPFGYRVPPEVWVKLSAHPERFDGEMPSASLVARIPDMAAAGRRGEVVIAAALIAGGGNVERVSDLALVPVVKALLASGFEKEARAVAAAAVKSYSTH